MEQVKKEAILHAAAGAFARYGFKKASIEEIARSAKVAKGTVYLACETKEDLFYQAVHREVRAFVAELAKLIDPRVPANELLARCAISSVAYMRKRPLVRDLIFRNHHLMLPEWAERLDALASLGRANVREILQLGVRQGRFRDDLDLDEVAKIIEDVGIATHVVHDRGPEHDDRLERRMRTAFELLMNGLRKP